MNNGENKLCKDCKHFVLEPDADGPGIPWCNNPQTKNLDHPIGWLRREAKACQFFEPAKVNEPDDTFIALNSFKDTSARKEHWSALFIKLCLCIAFLKFAFNGNEQMTFKLALFLVIVSTAREVTANLTKGSISVTR